jgi:protein-disulfide isomerase
MQMKTTLSMMLALLIAIPMFAAGAAKPVATIGTTPVTQDDLDRAVGAKLTRILTDEYNVRRGVLEDMIASKLIDAEAARRHVTTDELLKTEVDNKIVQPVLADIEPIYDGVSDRYPGMTKDQALVEIAEGMRHTRLLNRRAEFVKELRAAAGVQVYLQPPRVEVKAEGPSRGAANAPVTIVEFSDFECPFCSRVVETLQKVETTYGDKVRVVFRDYPLGIHRTAKRAAEASHCAEEQGKFWEMHDKMFAKGGPIMDADLYRYANQIKLDHDKFDACLTSGKFKEAYKTSQDEGTRVGVQSTPTFFINGRLIVGAASYEAFAHVIDEELANTQTQNTTKVASR